MSIDFRRIRALVFDLDGLLVDSEPTWFAVESQFLARLGHVWTREAADACMGQGTPNTLATWRERFGVHVDIDRDTEVILDEVIARAGSMKVKPGARAVIESARAIGMPMAVASSSRTRLIESVLRAHGLREFFHAIASGQEVKRGKPEPDVFLLAARRLNVDIDNCLVLEDALAGVRAGISAGAQVLAVPSVPSCEIDRLASLVVDRLDAIVPQLRQCTCSDAARAATSLVGRH